MVTFPAQMGKEDIMIKSDVEEDVLIADSSDNVEILEAKQAELRN